MKVDNSRIFGLDFLRVVAVFAVMYAHAGNSTIYGIKYGYIAIESFFVMSGFLIGEMLIKEFRNGFTFSDLKIFWVKRWYRTLPLYYAVLFLKFIFFNSEEIGWNVLYYVFFLQNNFYGIQFFAVSWTLVLEEWFYMIMPLLIYFFFRSGIEYKKFMNFVLIVIIGSITMRLLYGYFRTDFYDAVNGNFVLRFDAFIVGVGLAAIKVFNFDNYIKLANVKYFLFGIFLIIISQLFYYNKLGVDASELLGAGAIATRFIVMDIAVFFMLPFLCVSPIFSTNSEKNTFVKVLTWFSLLSYPMYLIHMEVQIHLPTYLPQIYFGGDFMRFLINTSVTVILSYIIYELIHEPMIKLRSYTVKRMKDKLSRKISKA
jgi:peptidoglycan/LPS O-acetylase OafA/YrhL